MYWHGAQEDTRRTVNSIIADRAMGILVVTGIGSSPCPLEDLKRTFDSITLNRMQFGPEEQLFIDANTRRSPHHWAHSTVGRHPEEPQYHTPLFATLQSHTPHPRGPQAPRHTDPARPTY